MYIWIPPYSNHMHCASINNTIDIRIWPQKQVSITNYNMPTGYTYLKIKKRITTSVRVFFCTYCEYIVEYCIYSLYSILSEPKTIMFIYPTWAWLMK